MRAPRCSKGTRRAQTPRLPPTIDGDADSSRPCRSWKGCGWQRETQSTAFLSAPGIEALYSGADHECIGGLQPPSQLLRPGREPLVALDVRVVGGAVELRHRAEIDRPSVARDRARSQLGKLRVQRALPQRGGEDKEGKQARVSGCRPWRFLPKVASPEPTPEPTPLGRGSTRRVERQLASRAFRGVYPTGLPTHQAVLRTHARDSGSVGSGSRTVGGKTLIVICGRMIAALSQPGGRRFESG
jgi:hypothetical protein